MWGKLGDLYGRKNLFQLAIVIFLGGSILSGLSQNMIELIAFRAIQGIGAGGLMVGAQAITGDVIPARQRGRYMGYFGAVFGLSSVLGPLAGGFFTQHLSWRWVFYINVPIGIVALFIVAAVLHIPAHRVQHKIDWLGISLLVCRGDRDHPADDLGRDAVRVGVVADHRSRPVGHRTSRRLLLRRDEGRRADHPAQAVQRAARSRAASGVGFIIGFSMFGAIVYLPAVPADGPRSVPHSVGTRAAARWSRACSSPSS